MPSKKVYVRQYTVKAHTRDIHTRVYKFICQHCRAAVERETYATCCPKYGNECNGVEKKCLRNKL
jgi:Zn finger protein HypA/HybF involved in hydrogenase expression